MSKINETAVVKRQYKKSDRLNTRISIHDKYSTNKLGFGNWTFFKLQVICGFENIRAWLWHGSYVEKQRRTNCPLLKACADRLFRSDDTRSKKTASESTAMLNTPLQTFKISRIATKPLTL